MSDLDTLEQRVGGEGDAMGLVSLSRRILDNPEIGLQEHTSARWLGAFLQEAGFTTDQPTAALRFIGLGAQPPTPDWGSMIAQARSYMIDF